MAQGSNVVHCLLLYGSQAKNSFILFGKKLISNMQKGYQIQISVSKTGFYWHRATPIIYVLSLATLNVAFSKHCLLQS